MRNGIKIINWTQSSTQGESTEKRIRNVAECRKARQKNRLDIWRQMLSKTLGKAVVEKESSPMQSQCCSQRESSRSGGEFLEVMKGEVTLSPLPLPLPLPASLCGPPQWEALRALVHKVQLTPRGDSSQLLSVTNYREKHRQKNRFL